MDTVRLRSTFNLILIALEAINKCLDTELSNVASGPYYYALVLLKAPTESLGKLLDGFNRSIDLTVITDQIRHLAWVLDRHLTGNNEENGNKTRKDTKTSFKYPRLREAINNFQAGGDDHTRKFESIVKSTECCNSLGEDMTNVYDELPQTQPVAEDDEDTCFGTTPPSTTHFSLVSAQVYACDGLFEKTYSDISYLKEYFSPDDILLPDPGKIKIEHERFKIWAANVDAFRRGRGPLHYRYKGFSEDFNLMRMLLDNIYSILDEYRTASNASWLVATQSSRVGEVQRKRKHPTAFSDSTMSKSSTIEPMTITTGGEDIATSSTKPSISDYVQVLSSIHSSIDWLHRLSNLLRRPDVINHNMRVKSYNMPIRDEYSLKSSFESLIGDKFPGLSGQLRSRLASTMVERRRRILYRRARLMSEWIQESVVPAAGAKKPDQASTLPSQINTIDMPVWSTVKTMQQENPLATAKSDLLSSETESYQDPSKWRAYADSLTPKASSVALNHMAKELLPPPPSACYTGLTFVCDYCCMNLDSRLGTVHALWKNHLQQDLDPYVCLFDRCNLPHDIYSTSKEWLHHMREEHRVKWRCSAANHDDVLDFEIEEDLAQHIRDAHPAKFDNKLLPYVLRACRTTSAVVFDSCPFCHKSMDAIEEHVSHHLQYLALKSLPRPELGNRYSRTGTMADVEEGFKRVPKPQRSSTEAIVEVVEDADHLKSTSYKYFFARNVQRSALEYDFEAIKETIKQLREVYPDLFEGIDDIKKNDSIAETLGKLKDLTGLGFVPEAPGKLEVGIVGAGVAGLFTAMVFDWLNEHPDLNGELKIMYDIFEAADRLGGRLYTYHFSAGDPVKTHDYYDVGAMRFPNNDIMKRTFQLFHLIGLDEGPGGLIPYYLEDELNRCPSYFNGVRCVGNPWKLNVNDPFEINGGLPGNGKIDPKFFKTDPARLVSEALSGFIDETKKKALEAIEEPWDETGKKEKFWKHMMEADHQSVQQFLMSPNNPHNQPKRTFNYNTIKWLETATYGTGWYDQALSECVLEELDFGTPKETEIEKKAGKKVQHWWCVEGGAQRIAELMQRKIKRSVQFQCQVNAINAHPDNPARGDPNKYVPITLSVGSLERDTKKVTKTHSKNYFAVFNSTTLGALQRMNLKDAGLSWGTKQAIRSLGYGASCKVAIKFKTAWWQEEPFCIRKGGLAHTDLPLRVCVYPSYNITKREGDNWSSEKPAVLLVSYTWGQDAQRIGALISNNSPEDEDQLIKVLLHDLALMHANDVIGYDNLLKILKDSYETHHAYDWYRDQNMSGAIAYFGPGQYSNIWQEIIKPNAFGQLYLVGEAASSHHAWIVGALESVIRAVYTMLEGLNSHDPEYGAYAKAMNLLSHIPQEGDSTYDPNDHVKVNPGDIPKGKPFYPLPEEMPDWQAGTTSEDDVTHDPVESQQPNKKMAYTTAVVSVCKIESLRVRLG